MPNQLVTITDGPDKPALQWALAYPDREVVHFHLAGDAMDAQIMRMDEMDDGFSFQLHGIVRSGTHKGAPFRGTHHIESRSGSLTIG